VFRGTGLVSWNIVYTKQAQKDARKIAAAGLKNKAKQLLDILRINPYQNPPPYEKLVGDLAGAYSRRINIQHRLVYQKNINDFQKQLRMHKEKIPQAIEAQVLIQSNCSKSR